jgi:hypothetical protein
MVYAPSTRVCPERLGRDDDPFDVERVLVDKRGHVTVAQRRVRVGIALRNELLELRPAGSERCASLTG